MNNIYKKYRVVTEYAKCKFISDVNILMEQCTFQNTGRRHVGRYQTISKIKTTNSA